MLVRACGAPQLSKYRLLLPRPRLPCADSAAACTGRRGFDNIGHAVIMQSRWDGAVEAFEILQRGPEMLTSQFSTSYSLVLNLLATRRCVLPSITQAAHHSLCFGIDAFGLALPRQIEWPTNSTLYAKYACRSFTVRTHQAWYVCW